MDNIIQTFTVLLILSLVTEKIVNLIKLSKISKRFEPKIEGLSPQDAEKARRKYTQTISIFVGIILALITKADLFAMISAKKYEFFWTCNEFYNINVLWKIVGTFLTGGFLSFGSQFFHDLLAILFEMKKLKGTLNNLPEAGKFNNIKEIDEHYLHTQLKDLVYKIAGEYLPIKLEYDNQVATITLNKEIANFPTFYPYESPVTGKELKISLQTN